MNALFHLILIGIAANLDNLGVGVAYGIRRIRVPAPSNLVIAAIAFLFTAASVWAGAFTGRFLADQTANAVGALLLIGVGIWVILAQWRPRAGVPRPRRSTPLVLRIWQEPAQADFDQSGTITLPESLVLGVALSINCFTNGFSAGLWKLGALPTALCTAFFSYLALWGGAWLGMRYAAQWLGNKAAIAAGCLLLLIGIHQLL